MTRRLSHRRALVTGASRGIGKAITRALLDAGAHVVATAQRPRTLDVLADDCSGFGDHLRTVAADLATAGGVDALCAAVRAIGPPDIIVNNAGILHLDTLDHLTDAMIAATFAVNVVAPMRICRTFVPDMIARRSGNVVNICSSSAYTGGGSPGHCAYSASKHALLGFSRALDEEVRAHGVRVSTVSPAGVTTDMNANRSDLDPASLMSPEDVAAAVMYQLESSGPGINYEMRLWRMLR